MLKTTIYKTNSLEDVKRIYKDRMEYTSNQLRLLERVTRNRKKNGEDFSIFEKNFNGASIVKKDYWDGYAVVGSVLESPEYSQQVEVSLSNEALTVDEVFQDIEREKEKLRQRKETMYKVLENLEDVYNYAIEKLVDIEKEAQKKLGKDGDLFLTFLL